MYKATKMEQLSRAHLFHIAALADCSVDQPGVDDASIDATIRHYGKFAPTDARIKQAIEVQLKATTDFEWKSGKCSFELKIKNYDDLRGEGTAPSLLLVYLMPKNVVEWAHHSPEGLITRYSMYWHNLACCPPVNNDRTRTIHLQQINIFSPQTLTEMMRRIARKKELGDVL